MKEDKILKQLSRELEISLDCAKLVFLIVVKRRCSHKALFKKSSLSPEKFIDAQDILIRKGFITISKGKEYIDRSKYGEVMDIVEMVDQTEVEIQNLYTNKNEMVFLEVIEKEKDRLLAMLKPAKGHTFKEIAEKMNKSTKRVELITMALIDSGKVTINQNKKIFLREYGKTFWR